MAIDDLSASEVMAGCIVGFAAVAAITLGMRDVKHEYVTAEAKDQNIEFQKRSVDGHGRITFDRSGVYFNIVDKGYNFVPEKYYAALRDAWCEVSYKTVPLADKHGQVKSYSQQRNDECVPVATLTPDSISATYARYAQGLYGTSLGSKPYDELMKQYKDFYMRDIRPLER